MAQLQTLLFLGLIALSYAGNLTAVLHFAETNWDCANAACSSRVKQGVGQPNYQCAEFVSRSLAAGGYIPGITPLASQNSYLNYKHNGVAYDLLWVSSGQGGPKGLEDLLKVLGWANAGTSASQVHAGSVLICTGSNGPHGHVAIGIGNDVTDAHNVARFHQPSRVYLAINGIYHPPN